MRRAASVSGAAAGACLPRHRRRALCLSRASRCCLPLRPAAVPSDGAQERPSPRHGRATPRRHVSPLLPRDLPTARRAPATAALARARARRRRRRPPVWRARRAARACGARRAGGGCDKTPCDVMAAAACGCATTRARAGVLSLVALSSITRPSGSSFQLDGQGQTARGTQAGNAQSHGDRLRRGAALPQDPHGSELVP